MDLYANQKQRDQIRLLEDATQLPVHAISAATGQGLEGLLEACWQRCTLAEEAGGWSKSTFWQ